MGITSAIGSALTGLTANAWATDVIASNIANAQTPGYGPRNLELAARTGGGVAVAGVQRGTDLALLNDRRAASAEVAGTGVLADFYTALETGLGQPGEAGALGTTLSDLGAALVQASAQPDSAAALSALLDSANAVAGKINALSTQIQTARGAADGAIGRQVTQLNTALGQVADLNAQIQSQVINGGQPSALIDQRQALLDQISEIVPIRQMERPNGTVALMTTGGALLLDGMTPATIGFTATNGTVTPDMTLASGALSGLTLNGVAVSSTSPLFTGGALAANLTLRDQAAPAAQSQLDALARDLAGRFDAPGVDPTLTPGMAGLFTDAGTPVSASNELGLAARFAVNPAVDPAKGGALWHLRAGIGAAAPNAPGDASILNAMGAALAAVQVPASGGLGTGAVDANGFAAQILSAAGNARLTAQNAASFATARSTTLTDAALKQGVDTDQQMAQLLVVQKSYAANAKVVQTADSMLQALLEI